MMLFMEQINLKTRKLEDHDNRSRLNLTKDLTNKVFGKLTVISFAGYGICTTRAIWLCKCSCGQNFKAYSTNLVRGNNKSCGCLLDLALKTHGFTKTKEYRHWSEIKTRCFNINSVGYQYYGAVGITMSDTFKNDFILFLNHIGEIPKDGKKYSVDRIDNSKGYIEGNIRWATDAQQARNKTMTSRNSSGVTGVKFNKGSKGYENFVAFWQEEIDGKSVKKSRSFSIMKYGYNEAFELACKARKDAITKLNDSGYGYTERHGK